MERDRTDDVCRKTDSGCTGGTLAGAGSHCDPSRKACCSEAHCIQSCGRRWSCERQRACGQQEYRSAVAGTRVIRNRASEARIHCGGAPGGAQAGLSPGLASRLSPGLPSGTAPGTRETGSREPIGHRFGFLIA